MVGERTDIVWRSLGIQVIRGKQERIQLFEALDATEGNNPEWVALFNEALDLLDNEEKAKAIELLQKVDQLRDGGDPPSQKMLSRLSSDAPKRT